jgi:hypothetical protein
VGSDPEVEGIAMSLRTWISNLSHRIVGMEADSVNPHVLAAFTDIQWALRELASREEGNGLGIHDSELDAARRDLAAANARVAELQAVIDRHDLCHNLHGKVDARAFADGCAQEQRRLYGCAPDADEVAALRACQAWQQASAVAVPKDVKAWAVDAAGYWDEFGGSQASKRTADAAKWILSLTRPSGEVAK